jgi:hypothetical protein
MLTTVRMVPARAWNCNWASSDAIPGDKNEPENTGVGRLKTGDGTVPGERTKATWASLF